MIHLRARSLLPAVALLALGCAGARPIAAPDADYDVVVVGAGGGGLAAAARLALGGQRVLVFEQRHRVGGYMTGFERGDYRFEVSLHDMDGLAPGGRSWQTFTRLGILDRVRTVRLDQVYTAVYPDFEVVVPADPVRYAAELKRLFPAEADGIDEFFAIMRHMYTAVTWKNLSEGGDQTAANRAVAADKQFWKVFFRFGRKSFGDLVDRCTDDPRLKAVLAWLSGYLGATPHQIPAMQAMGMWASYHHDGFFYFEGGSRAVSEALAGVIEEHGGEIRLGERVTRIAIEDGRAVAVETASGDRASCRYVVSNANAPATLFELVGREHLPRRYVRRVEALRIGPSIFQAYLGVDHDYSAEFGPTPTLSVFDSYDPERNMLSGVRDGDAEQVAYYLTNYSLQDPTAAPPGKNVIVITSYLPYDFRDRWQIGQGEDAHRALKEQVARIFIRRAERQLPELGAHVEVLEVGAPITMERFTGNPRGAVYGWAAGESMAAGTYAMPRRSPIPNLYLASAWSAGGGQSTVLAVGLTVAEEILDLEESDAP